jgi:hypothetical protein
VCGKEGPGNRQPGNPHGASPTPHPTVVWRRWKHDDGVGLQEAGSNVQRVHGCNPGRGSDEQTAVIRGEHKIQTDPVFGTVLDADSRTTGTPSCRLGPARRAHLQFYLNVQVFTVAGETVVTAVPPQ